MSDPGAPISLEQPVPVPPPVPSLASLQVPADASDSADQPAPSISTASNAALSTEQDAAHVLLDPAAPIASDTSDDDILILFDTSLAVLYKYPLASPPKSYDECPRVSDLLLTQSSMFVLSRGHFSVYKLLGQTIAYLRCGSIAHPILPKTRVWKIGVNQYILPQPVPRKFWRLELPDSGDDEVLLLDDILQKICWFQKVYVPPPAGALRSEGELRNVPKQRLRQQQQTLAQQRAVSSSNGTSMLVKQYEQSIMTTKNEHEAFQRRIISRRATLKFASENETAKTESKDNDTHGPSNCTQDLERDQHNPTDCSDLISTPAGTNTEDGAVAAAASSFDDPFGFPLSFSPPSSSSQNMALFASSSSPACSTCGSCSPREPSSPLAISTCASFILQDYPSPTFSDFHPHHHHHNSSDRLGAVARDGQNTANGVYTPEFSSSSSTLDNILDDFRDDSFNDMSEDAYAPTKPFAASSSSSAKLPPWASTAGTNLTGFPVRHSQMYSLDEQVLASYTTVATTSTATEDDGLESYTGTETTKSSASTTTESGTVVEHASDSSSTEDGEEKKQESGEAKDDQVGSRLKTLSIGGLLSGAVAVATAAFYGGASSTSTQHGGNSGEEAPSFEDEVLNSGLDWYSAYNKSRKTTYGLHHSRSQYQLQTRSINSRLSFPLTTPGSSNTQRVSTARNARPSANGPRRAGALSGLGHLMGMGVELPNHQQQPHESQRQQQRHHHRRHSVDGSAGPSARAQEYEREPGHGSPAAARQKSVRDEASPSHLKMLTPAEKHAQLFGNTSRYLPTASASGEPQEPGGLNAVIAMWGSTQGQQQGLQPPFPK